MWGPCISGSTLRSRNPLPLPYEMHQGHQIIFAFYLMFHRPNRASTFVMPNSHYRNLASVVYSYSNIVLRQRLVFTLDNMFLFSLFWITEIVIGILNHLQICIKCEYSQPIWWLLYCGPHSLCAGGQDRPPQGSGCQQETFVGESAVGLSEGSETLWGELCEAIGVYFMWLWCRFIPSRDSI